jgi:hypothetical protein
MPFACRIGVRDVTNDGARISAGLLSSGDGVLLRSRSAIEEPVSMASAFLLGCRIILRLQVHRTSLRIVRDLEVVLLFGEFYTKSRQVSTDGRRRNGSVGQHTVGDAAGAVLIIVENPPVPADRRVRPEVTALHQAGYTVSVICPKGQGYGKAYEQIDGVHIYRSPRGVEGSGAVTLPAPR